MTKNEKRRYLINFSTQSMSSSETDFLIVGSGIAGLRAAISLSEHGRVMVLTKDKTEECNSYLAQGGIAAAIGENDNVRYHVEDTLKTGVGLCCKEAVSILVEEGPRQIADFLRFGANFDMTGDNRIALTREGAHTRDRIVHAHGDAIGLELELTLIKKARSLDNIIFAEGIYLVDILTADQTAVGAIVYDPATLSCRVIYFKSMVLATGGIGYLFQNTTNSHIATGDGVAIARRAGAAITDMEFIQFHPTTLYLEHAPRFLISEAVRGEGAYLVNVNGERFMQGVHEMAELAPRDIVSREILKQIEKTSHPCVYLDITHRESEFLKARFPKIYSNCLRYGIDITTSSIPVKPSAHYMIGGIRSGLDGETNVAGLYVCGESACTYVHGANRLASNSLLECVVFGNRAANAAARYSRGAARKKINISYDYKFYKEPKGFSIKLHGERVINEIRKNSWENLGIVRNAEGFSLIERFLEKYDFIRRLELKTLRSFSISNMLDVVEVINRFCTRRMESRGTHFRSDFEATDDAGYKLHFVEAAGRLERLEVRE
ncbi:MAG TPA: L-aspartate oxidase [Candidatus Wallbacteria bacterium]|nr:L-aspartate oxidase [Candidatus Wallbacteria bacterium]